ncbi:unnamed protein product [Calicophoron daubneyi]|uniref:Mediator of DNA damage checkpoint protein 1 n=1 Tax=Calicophoron daubneyi TaxID=300641 RepID=A0AAV2TIZ4_CALDB
MDELACTQPVYDPSLDNPGVPNSQVICISVCLPDGQKLTHRLKQGLTSVGRTPENDLCIALQCLSQKHAVIEVDEDGVCKLTDKGSLNGTRRNDLRLKPHQSYELRPNDRVQFGSVAGLCHFPGCDIEGALSTFATSQLKENKDIDGFKESCISSEATIGAREIEDDYSSDESVNMLAPLSIDVDEVPPDLMPNSSQFITASPLIHSLSSGHENTVRTPSSAIKSSELLVSETQPEQDDHTNAPLLHGPPQLLIAETEPFEVETPSRPANPDRGVSIATSLTPSTDRISLTSTRPSFSTVFVATPAVPVKSTVSSTPCTLNQTSDGPLACDSDPGLHSEIYSKPREAPTNFPQASVDTSDLFVEESELFNGRSERTSEIAPHYNTESVHILVETLSDVELGDDAHNPAVNSEATGEDDLQMKNQKVDSIPNHKTTTNISGNDGEPVRVASPVECENKLSEMPYIEATQPMRESDDVNVADSATSAEKVHSIPNLKTTTGLSGNDGEPVRVASPVECENKLSEMPYIEATQPMRESDDVNVADSATSAEKTSTVRLHRKSSVVDLDATQPCVHELKDVPPCTQLTQAMLETDRVQPDLPVGQSDHLSTKSVKKSRGTLNESSSAAQSTEVSVHSIPNLKTTTGLSGNDGEPVRVASPVECENKLSEMPYIEATQPMRESDDVNVADSATSAEKTSTVRLHRKSSVVDLDATQPCVHELKDVPPCTQLTQAMLETDRVQPDLPVGQSDHLSTKSVKKSRGTLNESSSAAQSTEVSKTSPNCEVEGTPENASEPSAAFRRAVKSTTRIKRTRNSVYTSGRTSSCMVSDAFGVVRFRSRYRQRLSCLENSPLETKGELGLTPAGWAPVRRASTVISTPLPCNILAGLVRPLSTHREGVIAKSRRKGHKAEQAPRIPSPVHISGSILSDDPSHLEDSQVASATSTQNPTCTESSKDPLLSLSLEIERLPADYGRPSALELAGFEESPKDPPSVVGKTALDGNCSSHIPECESAHVCLPSSRDEFPENPDQHLSKATKDGRLHRRSRSPLFESISPHDSPSWTPVEKPKLVAGRMRAPRGRPKRKLSLDLRSPEQETKDAKRPRRLTNSKTESPQPLRRSRRITATAFKDFSSPETSPVKKSLRRRQTVSSTRKEPKHQTEKTDTTTETTASKPTRKTRGSKIQKVESPISKKQKPSAESANRHSLRKATPSLKEEKMQLIFSGIDSSHYKSVISALNATETEDPLVATHLITDSVKRTLKMLYARCRNIPIISVDWLEACRHCRKASSHPDPLQFSIPPDKILESVGSSKRFKRLSKGRSSEIAEFVERDQFLSGWSVCCTPAVLPPPTDLCLFVELAGGRWLSDTDLDNWTSEKAPHTVLITTLDELATAQIEMPHRRFSRGNESKPKSNPLARALSRMTCVSVEWILQSIMFRSPPAWPIERSLRLN